nr:unnamed protein product [Callosobruchus chinensis]
MTDTLLIYGEAKNNGRQEVRLYEQKFPNRRIPHHSTFASIEMRLRETGNLRTKRNNAGRPRTTRTVRIEEAILNNILERPSLSTRTIGKSINQQHLVANESPPLELVPSFTKKKAKDKRSWRYRSSFQYKYLFSKEQGSSCKMQQHWSNLLQKRLWHCHQKLDNNNNNNKCNNKSKCKALHINKGQWKNHPEQEIVAGQTLDNMDKNETYKYLGFNQSVKIDHTQVKGQLTQEFRDRLIRLLKTKLNSRNLTKAINTFAILVLTYSFGIINWLTQLHRSYPSSELNQILCPMDQFIVEHELDEPRTWLIKQR